MIRVVWFSISALAAMSLCACANGDETSDARGSTDASSLDASRDVSSDASFDVTKDATPDQRSDTDSPSDSSDDVSSDAAYDAQKDAPPDQRDETEPPMDSSDVDIADTLPDAEPHYPTQLEHRYTEHLGMLTGTTLNPTIPIGMTGTDLGVVFERDDKLGVLFGDAWSDNWDSLAWMSTDYPEKGMPKLTWVTGSDGKAVQLAVLGVNLGGMNVPVEGVPIGDKTYVFFSTGWYDVPEPARHTHSVLAHTTGRQAGPFTLDHKVASDKFINVSVQIEGSTAWIFGNGVYRASNIYLAKVDVAKLADRAAWRYWPKYDSKQEESAQPIVASNCAGEMSVRFDPSLNLWLMAYNCGSPRGIVLRTAPAPEGPWSDIIHIYRDSDGYMKYIHANEEEVKFDDGLSDHGREKEWGGEYGPYLIPRWTRRVQPGVYSIIYTFSSWNPYQAHLLRTYLAEPGVEYQPAKKGEGLPPAKVVNGDFSAGTLEGWTVEPSGWFGLFQEGGVWKVTSYVGTDTSKGKMWQDIKIDAEAKELVFFVHGGIGEVQLMHGDEVVRRSWGRRSNLDTEVRWNLEGYRGETVRLQLVDDYTGAWGFIGAHGFQIRK